MTSESPAQASESTALSYRATRVAIPTQPGRLTLYQAAELSDAISNIKVCCAHAFQRETGNPMPEHFAKRLEHLNGATLSIAQAAQTLRTWHKWTYGARIHCIPSLHDVQGFLFAPSR